MSNTKIELKDNTTISEEINIAEEHIDEKKINIDQYLREEFLSDFFMEYSSNAAQSFIRYKSRHYDSVMPNSKDTLEINIANLLTVIELMMDKNIIDRIKVEEMVKKSKGSLNHNMENLWMKNLPGIKINLDAESIDFKSHDSKDLFKDAQQAVESYFNNIYANHTPNFSNPTEVELMTTHKDDNTKLGVYLNLIDYTMFRTVNDRIDHVTKFGTLDNMINRCLVDLDSKVNDMIIKEEAKETITFYEYEDK